MMIETSSVVLLKNFPGTSFTAEGGSVSCTRRRAGRGSLERLYNTAWPSLLGQRASILGFLGIQMEEEIAVTCIRLQ